MGNSQYSQGVIHLWSPGLCCG